MINNVGTLKTVIKNIIPPVIYNILKVAFISNSKAENAGKKNKLWYDSYYEDSKEYAKHYTESYYYFIWAVIADRIMRADVKNIIDIGCGSGQFANLLYDKGVKNYCGVDLSSSAIEKAKVNCPDFEFISEDIFKSDILNTHDYDCFVSLECMEHLEDDMNLISMIKNNTLCYITVPNFPFISHVRHFNSKKEVMDRYGNMFSDIKVDSFLKNISGGKFFLLEGIKV